MVGQGEGVLNHVESFLKSYMYIYLKSLALRITCMMYLVPVIVHKEMFWLLHGNVHIQDFQIIYC